MDPARTEPLGLGLRRGSGAVAAGAIRSGSTVTLAARRAIAVAARLAIPVGPAAALAARLPIAIAARAPISTVSTVSTVTPLAAVASAATCELRGDELVVLHGTSDDLQGLHWCPVLGLRREDGHDLGAVERELDVGSELLADHRSGREQLRPQYALGLLCSGGTPAPRAIGTVTGQLDVDPARHRGANLLGGRGRLVGDPGTERRAGRSSTGERMIGADRHCRRRSAEWSRGPEQEPEAPRPNVPIIYVM